MFIFLQCICPQSGNSMQITVMYPAVGTHELPEQSIIHPVSGLERSRIFFKGSNVKIKPAQAEIT